MYALQPELRARRPVAEFVADMADQLDGRGRDPPHPVPRIGRHQPLDAPAPPALPPPPNCPGTDSIVPASGRWPVLPCISQHQQAIPHPRPILLPHLHIAELDHWPPLAWTVWSGCPSKQRRSILSRYFTGDPGLDSGAVVEAVSRRWPGALSSHWAAPGRVKVGGSKDRGTA